MSGPEDEPEDIHGECALEISRLRAELAAATAEVASVREESDERYKEASEIERRAQTHSDMAESLRGSYVEASAEVRRLTAELAAVTERAERAGALLGRWLTTPNDDGPLCNETASYLGRRECFACGRMEEAADAFDTCPLCLKIVCGYCTEKGLLHRDIDRAAALGEVAVSDPFRIEGPAYISFSGGRTSGYMLRRVLDAYGGELPSDIHVVFANTGREMPETLNFVHAVETQWGIQLPWVEYALDEKDCPIHVVVDYDSAARDGEPFAAYLDHVERVTASKGDAPYLPGPGLRVCTTELKIRVMKRWMLDRGYEHWNNVVGIRYDEPRRWKTVDRTCPKERWEIDFPLVDAKVTVRDVKDFWRAQPFDLNLRGDHEGNCDACHLKRPWKVAQVFKDHPERAEWWLERERRAGKQFRPNGPSIAQLVAASRLPIVRDKQLEIQCVGCTD